MKTNVNAVNKDGKTAQGNNLPPVEIEDKTTTTGDPKRGGNESAKMEKTLSKNEIFAKLKNFFTPEGCVFDDSKIVEGMQTMVDAGILPEAAMAVAIEKARKEFETANEETLRAAEHVPFGTFLSKLQENSNLYKLVCGACNVPEISEGMVFDNNGNVVIYRGGQSEDKEGNKRYTEGTITRTAANGQEFSEKVFYEIRKDFCVSNYVAAIRYYSFYLDVLKKVTKACKESEELLKYAVEAVKSALNAGFALEDIMSNL